MPTFNITARPVVHEQHDGYATTSYWLFGARRTDTIDVDSPVDIAVALRDWAYAHDPAETNSDTPDGTPPNAWAMAVVKPSRWPAGYKQAGERTHTFVVRS